MIVGIVKMIGRFVGMIPFNDFLAVPMKETSVPQSKSKDDEMLPLRDEIGFGKDEIDNSHDISFLNMFKMCNPSFFTQMTFSFKETRSRSMEPVKMI